MLACNYRLCTEGRISIHCMDTSHYRVSSVKGRWNCTIHVAKVAMTSMHSEEQFLKLSLNTPFSSLGLFYYLFNIQMKIVHFKIISWAHWLVWCGCEKVVSKHRAKGLTGIYQELLTREEIVGEPVAESQSSTSTAFAVAFCPRGASTCSGYSRTLSLIHQSGVVTPQLCSCYIMS